MWTRPWPGPNHIKKKMWDSPSPTVKMYINNLDKALTSAKPYFKKEYVPGLVQSYLKKNVGKPGPSVKTYF